jgi:oligoribonuclease NrnB/cAMP/cGMP phosphodiesterase (DHH superfamily)
MSSRRQQKLASTLIVHHASCLDGVASAWIIAKSLGVEDINSNPQVTYLPFDHANKAGSEAALRAAVTPDAEIYFADITPEKALLEELIAAGHKVHILDHHESVADEIAEVSNMPNLDVRFDDKAPSAAKMIWKALLPSEPPPPLIGMIDKMDGAAAGLTTAQDFAAAALIDSRHIQPMKTAFATLRGLAKMSFNEMAKKGRPLIAGQNMAIDSLLATAKRVKIKLLPGAAPVSVPIVNADLKHYGRQISQRLIEAGKNSGANAAFAWAVQKNGSVYMSIRTSGAIDASRIAAHLCKTMGLTGGGHQDSAAVTFPSLTDFVRKMPLEAIKTPDIKRELRLSA